MKFNMLVMMGEVGSVSSSVYVGWQYYVGLISDKKWIANMDVLIAMGSAASIFLPVLFGWLMVNVYFETAV
jgi:cation transport ATPase